MKKPVTTNATAADETGRHHQAARRSGSVERHPDQRSGDHAGSERCRDEQCAERNAVRSVHRDDDESDAGPAPAIRSGMAAAR